MSDATSSEIQDGIEDVYLRLEGRYKAPESVAGTRCLRVTLPDDLQFYRAFTELVSRLGFESVWEEQEGSLANWQCAALGTAITIEDCLEGGVLIGTMYWWGAGLPDKHLDCDGSLHNRNNYPDLFALWGYTFGGADDLFAMPNTRGRFIIGRQGGDPDYGGMGQTGGEEDHTLTEAEMPAHTHTIRAGSSDAGGGTAMDRADFGVNLAGIVNVAGAGAAHNNMPPFIALRMIVRALP